MNSTWSTIISGRRVMGYSERDTSRGSIIRHFFKILIDCFFLALSLSRVVLLYSGTSLVLVKGS